MDNDDWTFDELLDMADAIGDRMRAGDFPRQDELGRYVFSDRDLNLI